MTKLHVLGLLLVVMVGCHPNQEETASTQQPLTITVTPITAGYPESPGVQMCGVFSDDDLDDCPIIDDNKDWNTATLCTTVHPMYPDCSNLYMEGTGSGGNPVTLECNMCIQFLPPSFDVEGEVCYEDVQIPPWPPQDQCYDLDDDVCLQLIQRAASCQRDLAPENES